MHNRCSNEEGKKTREAAAAEEENTGNPTAYSAYCRALIHQQEDAQ
jgi:hypothetical protein